MLDDKPEKQTEVETLVGSSWSQETQHEEIAVPQLNIPKLKTELGL